MQVEYAAEKERAAEHQERLAAAFRRVRAAIDDFAPDAVIVFGDDQYENFREDRVPPFCVYLFEEMESRPYLDNRYDVGANPWQEPPEQVFRFNSNKCFALFPAGR